MRAARLHTIGGTLQLDEVEVPDAGDGEVLVDMAFASVNPLDIWVTRGAPGTAADNLPWVPGTEGAGRVDGRPVLIRGAGIGVVRQGLYRERANVPTSAVMALPDGINLAKAAGIGVAGITAYHCLHTKAQVAAGDRVLVLGASGGVGAMAVQLAKLAGATVWGQTGSEAKAAGIRALGAEHVLVCGPDELAAQAAEFAPTVVLDGLSGRFSDAAIAAAAPGGRLVVFGTSADQQVTLDMRQLYRKGITLYGYAGLLLPPTADRDALDALIGMVGDGSLDVPIGAVLGLGGAAEAHARILDRQVEGKIVLDCNA